MGSLADFRGVCFDEAHNLKNPSAKRTKAARKVVDIVGPDAGRYLLTGTPILNRPEELIQPLLMLGFLRDEPGSKLTSAWFRNRFCRGTRRDAELADLIRTFCLRRTKDQVLTELPAKTRADQWTELDAGTLARYHELAEQGLEAARQTQAAAIVYINRLRLAVSEVKRRVALEWALNFLESTDKQLVVFAFYQDTQQALIDGLRGRGYPVTHILGGQADVDAHTARFQAGESRVIVCSLPAAYQGHTLTAASDVLMVDQEWRPGVHWQAEDRCHRMGQASAVTAWYLLATGTIDEWLFNLIDGKANLVRAVMDGASDAEETATAVAYLMGMLESQVTSRALALAGA